MITKSSPQSNPSSPQSNPMGTRLAQRVSVWSGKRNPTLDDCTWVAELAFDFTLRFHSRFFAAVLSPVGGQTAGAWLDNLGNVKCPDIAETHNRFAIGLAQFRDVNRQELHDRFVVGVIASVDEPWRMLGLDIPLSSSLHVVPFVSTEELGRQTVVVSDPWGRGARSFRVHHDFTSGSYRASIPGVAGSPPWTRSGPVRKAREWRDRAHPDTGPYLNQRGINTTPRG